jgi:glutamyl-tRNA reductase
MEDLQSFVERGVAERRKEVARVQAILDVELETYLAATSAREVSPAVVAMRSRAEEVRSAELIRFQSRLAYLEPSELEAVEALTRSIVAKLLHEPTVVLKGAAGTARGDRLLGALRELFGIEGVEGSEAAQAPPGPQSTADTRSETEH